MFLLESPHRGDSNEHTQYTVFIIKNKFTLNYPRSATMGFFHGTQERVRNNVVNSGRATEFLPYVTCDHATVCK